MAGKSENTERVSFKIDPELFEKFQFFAWENGASMAEVFRDALRFYAQAFMPSPEQQEQAEAVRAQVRAERAQQEYITALPTLRDVAIGLLN